MYFMNTFLAHRFLCDTIRHYRTEVHVQRAQQPISIHPEFPHYLAYLGSPLLLVASDAAYGIVLDRSYDFRTFLNTVADAGMNFTRIYTGATPPYWFGKPTILPWPRDPVTGRYDLSRWDELYFERLIAFVEYAEARGVIVDVCFFNGTGSFQGQNDWYAEPTMALNPSNNLQNIGSPDARDVISVKDAALLEVETRYVREITQRLNRFGNVIYDIADEPDNVGDDRAEDYTAWQDLMLNTCYHAEDDLPLRHPISVCAAGKNWKLKNFAADPSTAHMISWISIEYTEFAKLESLYRYNRPIVLIESARFSSDGPPNREYNGSDADATNSSRAEAWEFMLGGAAGHMQFNCDWGYSVPRSVPSNPNAAGTLAHVLMAQKRMLKQFLESIKCWEMAPVQCKCDGAIVRGIGKPGDRYAFYLHHSHISRGPWPDFAGYTVEYGNFQDRVVGIPDVPQGIYAVEWISPASAKIIGRESITHPGDGIRVTAPPHSYDLAMTLQRR